MFQSNAIPTTLFIKDVRRKVVVLLYVDDIMVIGNNLCEISQIKKNLDEKFEIREE